MIGDIFNTVLYQPFYNGLVFLVSVVPFGDVGIAIIILTLIVKSALFPLTHKSVKTQAKLKKLEPEIREIKEKHKEDKQEQAKKVMEVYKAHGVNPFSGCLLFIVQIPFLIALYWVFSRGLADGGFDPTLLYSFIDHPEAVNFHFLGLVNMDERSIVLALLAGFSQFIQMKFAMPSLPETKTDKPSLKNDFARSMRLQMKYGLPIIVTVISYTISSAVALYWVTANVFAITHELIVRRKAKQITNKSDTKHANEA